MLPGGHGLVAQIGVARENLPRLLIRVLRKVAEGEHDLVLDVERGVAVVAEVLALGHDDAVAGEHHVAACLAVVGKGERPHVGFLVEGAIADGQPRAAVFGAGGELERHAVIALAGERLRADLLQRGGEIVAGEPLARRSGEPPFKLLRGERLHVRARFRRCVENSSSEQERCRERGERRNRCPQADMNL